jgi:hypothetical protein
VPEINEKMNHVHMNHKCQGCCTTNSIIELWILGRLLMESYMLVGVYAMMEHANIIDRNKGYNVISHVRKSFCFLL